MSHERVDADLFDGRSERLALLEEAVLVRLRELVGVLVVGAYRADRPICMEQRDDQHRFEVRLTTFRPNEVLAERDIADAVRPAVPDGESSHADPHFERDVAGRVRSTHALDNFEESSCPCLRSISSVPWLAPTTARHSLSTAATRKLKLKRFFGPGRAPRNRRIPGAFLRLARR